MVDKELLKETLAVALNRGGDFAEIFVESRQVAGIGLEGGKVERMQSGVEAGAGVRVLAGKATAYAYTNELDRNGLLRAARIASRALGNGGKDITLDLTTLRPPVVFEVRNPPETVPAEEKAEKVKEADRSARAVDAERIKQVMVGYGDVVQDVIVANSAGVHVEDRRVRTRFVVNAVAADGVIQTGAEAAAGVVGFELFDSHDPGEMGTVAAIRAKSLLKAQPAPSGRMPVVLSGAAGGTMVHEACGHGLEADLVQKGLSIYGGKQGQKVAASTITVEDDTTLAGKYGSYAFDDEGVPSRPVTLIRNGVLEDYLYDRLSAVKENGESNGHGRRESYQHKPIPRMGNTYIAAGRDDPEQIVREAGSGLLVQKMGGGQVNTTTGDFVFEVAEGYLIRDGEVGPMVRGATLTGNGPEVLRRVALVGNDLGFTIGTCGKEGQGVPVSDAQPTLLLGRSRADSPIVVGGTRQSSDDGPEVRAVKPGDPFKDQDFRLGRIRRL
ncbi:MAG: TldD/PmbA family protein [Candidatus Desulforudis sp.]|nr:TldD/PmbA family protein [Desulforudis sp.]